jgi:hypothetical protein
MTHANTIFDTGLPRRELLITPNAARVDQIGQVMDQEVPLHRIRLQLDAVKFTVAGASDFGSVELCTFPDRNLIVIGAEINLSIVKGGAATGIVAATDLDIALGTAAASSTTLSGAMLNILPKQDVDADSLTVTSQAHSLAATPVLTGILDAVDNKMYFNVAIPGLITVDDTLTLTGTIDLFVFDLFNVTS